LRGGNYQGPYLQYQSDTSLAPSFRAPGSAVGPGTPNPIAMANPVIIQRMAGGKGTLCNSTGLDNYNHVKNSGFVTNAYNTGFSRMNQQVFSNP
jgi:hypothetical protein